MTLLSFLGFTFFAAFLTFLLTKGDEKRSSDGFFLGGRSLTFPVIAGSLLLTNLSTEQMVGLNGAAFKDGLRVMAWEVVAVIALVLMALFFLPRFLKAGITTVPQFLEDRFDRRTQTLANMIFLVAYGTLVREVLPAHLTGFFAAVMVGAILSSFNAALNSTSAHFSIGLYHHVINPRGSEEQMVREAKVFVVCRRAWIGGLVAVALIPMSQCTPVPLSERGCDRGCRPDPPLPDTCTVVRCHFGPPRHGSRAAVFDRRQHGHAMLREELGQGGAGEIWELRPKQ